jgi:uncharacterized protein
METPPLSGSNRNTAMDAARGLAVLGMIFIHLVPTEGAVTWAGRLATAITRHLSGKPAALFFVLAGMAWALQQQRAGWTRPYLAYVIKRSLVLVALGLLLHLLIWPTEVLTALGIALPIVAFILSQGRRAVWTSLVLILFAVPLLSHQLHAWALKDWSDAGEPRLTLASSGRLLFFDGDYPLIPWIAFVLVGMLIVQIKTRYAVWAVASLATSLAALLLVHVIHAEPGSTFCIDWTPTTLPFLLVCGGVALATVFGLSWVRQRPYRSTEPVDGRVAFRSFRRLNGWRPLTSIGAMSLTHYIGHIVLVVVPLRYFFPEEEWPTRIGLICFASYLVVAMVFSMAWLARHRRGPLESTLAWITGSPRSSAVA